jgi:Protein of unknown function (DUF2750)
MTYEMDEKQFETVIGLSAQERYEYFLEKVIEFKEVWSLRNDDGFVSMADDNGEECIPFWPHPDYARALATVSWSDCKPEVVSLDGFLEKWLVGMEKDKLNVTVFPAPGLKGAVVTPEHLKEDLQAE